jgi:hypothetical protein
LLGPIQERTFGTVITKNSKIMKKLLLSAAILTGVATSVNAQLPDGSIAPNFTVTDISGGSHTLYDYLDQGYTVIMDLSATWCGPCWSYHTGGTMEDVWANHGPAGEPGVLASTTDDVVILHIEADASTTLADLNGTGGNTQGDWVTGTDYPIVDDASLNGPYALGYYPTIYTICPNRVLTESGQATAAAHYGLVGDCPVASGVNNPGLIQYTGETVSCGGSVDIVIDLMNMGSANLTAATIEVFEGATSVLSYNWTGNLATYAMESVNVGSVTPTGTTNYSIEITSTDDDASNNVLAQTISDASQTDISVTVDVHTDGYGDEIYMEITNGTGAVVWFEGNETGVGTTNIDLGVFPPPADATNPLQNDTDYSWDVSLPAVGCYTFTIYDYYGDGLADGGTGAGYDVRSNLGTLLFSEGNLNFGGMEVGGAIKNNSVGLDELAVENVNIYPNPVADVLNVAFTANDSEYTVSVMDLQGRVIATQVVGGTGTQNVTFSVADVASGSYIVTIASEDESHTDKVVIK